MSRIVSLSINLIEEKRPFDDSNDLFVTLAREIFWNKKVDHYQGGNCSTFLPRDQSIFQ